MKTFMIATLTAGAFASEIPTISLDLTTKSNRNTFKHTSKGSTSTSNRVDNNSNSFARRCHVRTDDGQGDLPADCPSPTASAHDHHDGEIPHDQIVVTATQFVQSPKGAVPTQVDTNLGAAGVEQFTDHKGLATAYYKQRGEFVLTYNVDDANGNSAESLVFAMIMVDEEPPSINTIVASKTVEACTETTGNRCLVTGFANAGAMDAYDGALSGNKFTYTQGSTVKNVDSATTSAPIQVSTQGTPGTHDIVFTATDWADIFGASNTNNVATETITITAEDTTPPRVYLVNAAVSSGAAKTGADYEENKCGTEMTMEGKPTDIPSCLQWNMRKVVKIGTLYDSNVAKCEGCKGNKCFTVGTDKCTAVEAAQETFECGVAPPSDLFDAAGKAKVEGAFGVDDRQSASTTSNENRENVLSITTGTETFDNTKSGLHTQTFTYTTTAEASASATAAGTATKTRTINVVDTTKPVLKITHLGHKDLTVDTSADYHTHDGTAINTGLLTEHDYNDPLVDLHVIQHSAGYVADEKFINGLMQPGVGWTCVDSCQGTLTNVAEGTSPSATGPTTAAYSKAEWFKNGDCSGTKTSSFKTLEKGDWSIKYTCTDGVNPVTACRKIENKDHAKPIITILEGDNDTYEATKEDNYVDAGATCQDEVDGNISQDVEVSGDVVNLARVGTYQIFYNCKDSAQNEADPATRTVVVEDTRCPTCTIDAAGQNLDIEASFTFKDTMDTDVHCTDELQTTIVPTATIYKDDNGNTPFTGTDISKTVGTYYIRYIATDSVGNTNAGDTADAAKKCKINDVEGGQPKADFTRTVTVRDTLIPVIKLSLGGSVIKEGTPGSSDAANFDSSTYVADPAVAGTQHWAEKSATPSLMAEESSTTAVNGWVMGAVASAVSGLALLGYSLRRGAAPVATSVPV